MNSKGVTDLNINAKLLKHLDNNRKNLVSPGLNDDLDKTPKA